MKDNFSSTTYYKISVFIWDQKSISDINKCFLKNQCIENDLKRIKGTAVKSCATFAGNRINNI